LVFLTERLNHFALSEENLTLGVLFLSEDECLASLEDVEGFGFRGGTLELEHDLLGLLGLLPENRLSLSAESFLLHVISPLTLSHNRVLALLVLRHLVHGMSLGFPAVSSDRLWNMHHFV